MVKRNNSILIITGRLIKEKSNIILNSEIIRKTFNFFHRKVYFQVPPMYSAIKIEGQKMYNLARKNIYVDIAPRKVHIYDLKILSFLSENLVKFYVDVSKGTYIRSLARDIGEKMNTYGSLQNLVRTCIGSYCLNNAKFVDFIEKKDLIDKKEFFKNCNKIILNSYLIKLVKNGIYLDHRQIDTKNPFIVLDSKKNWIAYYEPIEKNKYCPKFFF